MNTHADKTQESKKQTTVNGLAQKPSSDKSTFQFADNRSEATVLRKLQTLADSNPKVQQLKAYQESANNSPQAKKTIQMQATIQGNWTHWAGGALLGATGAVIGGATLPVILGAAAVAGVAGGVAGHIWGASDSEEETPYKFGDSVQGHYKNWSEEQGSNMSVQSRGGIDVRARHNRGAPYITRSGVGDKYAHFIPGTVGDEDDRHVAGDLLNNTDHAIRTDAQKENAAMMEAVVGLGEEWRKHGAAWVYRAILRGVEGGKWTMSQVPKLFAFVKSANSGRRQVARIQDVKAGRLPPNALVGEEQDIMNYGSDIDDDGFESDDDVRGNHHMKGRRLFSTKYDDQKMD